jgi:hypothetical protein
MFRRHLEKLFILVYIWYVYLLLLIGVDEK